MILGFNGTTTWWRRRSRGGARRAAGAAARRTARGAGDPVIESQTLAQSQNGAAGAVVRGVTPADLKAMSIITGNIKSGSLAGFGEGDDGGNVILVGARLAEALGVKPGDPITLVSPRATPPRWAWCRSRRTYVVGGLFQIGMRRIRSGLRYMPLSQAQLFFSRGPRDRLHRGQARQPRTSGPALSRRWPKRPGEGPRSPMDREEPGLLSAPSQSSTT